MTAGSRAGFLPCFAFGVLGDLGVLEGDRGEPTEERAGDPNPFPPGLLLLTLVSSIPVRSKSIERV